MEQKSKEALGPPGHRHQLGKLMKERKSARMQSELRGAIHWCDNRCSEKSLRYTQIASLVTEQGGEARTIILCGP